MSNKMKDFDKEFNPSSQNPEGQNPDELQDEASRGIEESTSESFKVAGEKGKDVASNRLKKQLGLNNPSKDVAGRASDKTAGFLKKGAKKAGNKMATSAKALGKGAGQLLKQGAAAAAKALVGIGWPVILAFLAAFGIVWIVSLISGLIVENEFSRTNEANYDHVDSKNANTIMSHNLSADGNVYFNTQTGRYEMAKNKMPTESNKLYYVYYAVMSNQSRWFVNYDQQTIARPGDATTAKKPVDPDEPGAGSVASPQRDNETDEEYAIREKEEDQRYFKPHKVDADKAGYTLDGYMFNQNVISKVGLERPVADLNESDALSSLFDEQSVKAINNLSLNVNLIYLLDSTLNGSMKGTGKQQMFFGEQFIKPVYHDKNYNFKALTKHREMTREEKAKYSSKAHGAYDLDQPTVATTTVTEKGTWEINFPETPLERNDEIKFEANGKKIRTLSVPRATPFRKTRKGEEKNFIVNPMKPGDTSIKGNGTPGELIKVTLPRTSKAEDGKLEKEFQQKYSEFTEMVETQNEARGGNNTTEEEDPKSSGADAQGIDNPILQKAVEWGLAQRGKGITYSMGNRGGPMSYDCSSFVTTALKEAGFPEPYMGTTVSMLQQSNALGQSGTVFKEVKLETAKKGTIVVGGGLGGGGAGGHTFFLLEDYHGPQTKVLECSFGANGINDQGTFEWAASNGNPVALEPNGSGTGGGSSEGDKEEGGKDSKGHSSKDLSMTTPNTYKYKISTGELNVKSREYDTSYTPEIITGLNTKEDIEYNVWREDDFYIGSKKGIGVSLGTDLDVFKYSNAVGNSQFSIGSGAIKGKSGKAKASNSKNIEIGDYSKDRAALTQWSLENGYNPAFTAALIAELTKNSNKDLFGNKYNFTNDKTIVKEGDSGKKKDDGAINKELEKIINDAMKDLPKSDVGEPYWSISVKGITDPKIKVDVKSGSAPSSQWSASVIKTYIAITAYQQIEKGTLSKSDVQSDVRAMMNQSNNEATNRMIDKVGGMGEVNKTIKGLGDTGTVLKRKMLDQDAINSGNDNLASASGISNTLVDLDKGNILNAENTKELLGYMTNTNMQEKFMADLPSGAKGVNKSGENIQKGIANDSAIIEYKGQKFAITGLVAVQKDGTPKNVPQSQYDAENKALAKVAKEVTEAIGNSKSKSESSDKDKDKEKEDGKTEGSGEKESKDFDAYDKDYGKEQYNVKYDVNNMTQGLEFMMDKFVKDNSDYTWNAKVAKDSFGMNERSFKRVNEYMTKFGARSTTNVRIKDNAMQDLDFYTYKGNGPEDSNALGVISKDGKVDDTKIDGQLKYFKKTEYIEHSDAVRISGNKGVAIKRDSSGNPKKKTGVWDYGLGSIFKMSMMDFNAWAITVDEKGVMRVQDQGFLKSDVVAKNTRYQLLGVTTPFGTINMGNDLVEEQWEFMKVFDKVDKHGAIPKEAYDKIVADHNAKIAENEALKAEGKDPIHEIEDISYLEPLAKLSNTEVEKLNEHKRSTLEGQDVSPGNNGFFVTNEPILKEEPTLSDSNGGQYVIDYLTNYETYVPTSVESNLDVIDRWNKMNDANGDTQDAIHKVTDIFNKLIGDTGEEDSSSSGSGLDLQDAQKQAGQNLYDALIDQGMSSAGAIGIMANFLVESNWDPTTTFGVYDSPFKVSAADEANLVKQPPPPIGLGQWLGGRNTALQNYAKEKNKNWYDLELQMDFMFNGESDGAKEVLMEVAKQSKKSETQVASRGFFMAWEMHGGNMSMFYADLSDSALNNNPDDRLDQDTLDKLWDEYAAKDPKEADMAKLKASLGNSGSGSSGKGSGSDSDQPNKVSSWGDGTGFLGSVNRFLKDIRSVVMTIFGGSPNWDPTMFATDPTKNEKTLYKTNEKGEIVETFKPDSLYINGTDAYQWKKFNNKLSNENAGIVLEQFAANMESRDARPVYYDEIHNTFNRYDIDRIIEENYKANLSRIFQREESMKENTSRASLENSIFEGEPNVKDTKVTKTFGWYKNGKDKVEFNPGIIFKTDESRRVAPIKRGTVVWSGNDKRYGKTIIIRSVDNSEQIAYSGFGQLENFKVGQDIDSANFLGKTGSDNTILVQGISSTYNASKGLPPTPNSYNETQTYFDISEVLGSRDTEKLVKDVNGYESKEYSDKKPEVKAFGKTKEVKLGEYLD